MVVLSWPWWMIGLWCFYCSEINYFIVLKAKIDPLLQCVVTFGEVKLLNFQLNYCGCSKIESPFSPSSVHDTQEWSHFWLWGHGSPPPKILEKKKKRSIYINITYRFQQFCPYKIRLAPLNKIFDPFKQNEKSQETFTNLKSQTKQISKPKKLANNIN